MTTVAFSYPLAMPAARIAKLSFLIANSVAVSRSEFTGLVDGVYDWGGQTLGIRLELPPLKRPTAAAAGDVEDWFTWLLKLNGAKGTALIGPVGRAATPRGPATGTPVVNGAGQTGNQFASDGWTASQTPILRKGDWLSIENRLYKLLEDANSNGTGQATLTVWPSLRAAPADNAAITVNNPRGLYRLVGDQSIDLDEAEFYGIALDFEETA
jgi:hypothetical protein